MQDHPVEHAAAGRRIVSALTKGDERPLAIDDIFGDHRQRLIATRIDPYIGTDWAHGGLVAEAKTGSYGRLSAGKLGIGSLTHHPRVKERRAADLLPHRKACLHASLENEISAQGTRFEIAILEIARFRIALRYVSAAGAGEIRRVVCLQRSDRNGEHARTELILAVSAYRA